MEGKPHPDGEPAVGFHTPHECHPQNSIPTLSKPTWRGKLPLGRRSGRRPAKGSCSGSPWGTRMDTCLQGGAGACSVSALFGTAFFRSCTGCADGPQRHAH